MAPNSQLQEAGAEAEAEGVAFNQARRLRLVKRRELLALDYLLSLHTVFTYMYIYKVTLWQALAQSKELARAAQLVHSRALHFLSTYPYLALVALELVSCNRWL